jgi:hypothetical protein
MPHGEGAMSKTLGNLLLSLAVASFAIAWSKASEGNTASLAAVTALHNFQANVMALRSTDGTDPVFVFVGP